MAEGEFKFRLNLDSVEEAKAIEADVKGHGGSVEMSAEKGILPLAILLVVFIPPGAALLALITDRIVHGWRTGGVIIDARGTGAPTIIKERSLPYGTVVILSRDGETSKRTDLPEIDLGKYIEAALKAAAGGATASAAKAAGEKALKA